MRSFLILLPLLLVTQLGRTQSSAQLAYIEQYKDIAVLEMDRAGIPASIKLAQGLLESASGDSFLARRANNHFGIKCGSAWDGKKMYREDDDYDEAGRLQKSCFRAYRNPEESFIAHSEFLRDPRKEYRYGFLFRLDPTDYRGWAKGLKKSGYATSATYDKKLISIIERYELYRFDQMSSPDVLPDLNPTKSEEERVAGITYNNDVRVVIVASGETPADVARRSGVPLEKIRKYNEQLPGRDSGLEEGTLIYLQSKRNSFRGPRKYHYVQEGETMYEIAQMYGMKLSKLYSRNMMPMGSQPAAGEQIRLRGNTRKEEERPRLVSEGPGIVSNEEFDLEDDFWSPEIPILEPERPAPDDELEMEEMDELDPITPILEPDDRPDEPEVEVVEPDLPEPPAPVLESFHTVIKGDTLYSLSRRYGTTVDEIKRLNDLSNNIISVGQKLRIK